MKNQIQHYLVGGLNPLKNMKVNWDDDIPNIWENAKFMATSHHQAVFNIIEHHFKHLKESAVHH